MYSIGWGGREYPVKESGLFAVIDAIERHITLPELLAMQGSGRPNFSLLATSLHAMLTHAGVRDVPDPLALRRMMVDEGLSNLQAKAKGEQTPTGTAMAAIAIMTKLLMDGAPQSLMGSAEDGKKKVNRSPRAATKLRSVNGA
jgi:hypothetical protein